MNATHLKEELFTCETCGTRFSQKSHLRAHERIHSEERPFTCETWKSHLRSHKHIHRGERQYEFNKGDGEFSDQNKLTKLRCEHDEDRQFRCDQYDETFPSINDLNVHTPTHSSEETFRFNQGEITFTGDFNLTNNMCTHKGKKLFKCHPCDMTFILEDGLKSHMHEFHSEDEANRSMQSYMNIQSAFPQEFIPQTTRSSVSFAEGSIDHSLQYQHDLKRIHPTSIISHKCHHNMRFPVRR